MAHRFTLGHIAQEIAKDPMLNISSRESNFYNNNENCASKPGPHRHFAFHAKWSLTVFIIYLFHILVLIATLL
jgi:hypothetical protein